MDPVEDLGVYSQRFQGSSAVFPNSCMDPQRSYRDLQGPCRILVELNKIFKDPALDHCTPTPDYLYFYIFCHSLSKEHILQHRNL